VAELALSLMLALSRNIAAIDRRIRSGVQVSKAQEGSIGMQLHSRSFGIIGGGNIGLYLAKMIRGAFDGEIYLFDPVLSPANAQRWAELVPTAHLHRASHLGEILPHVDVLSLHVPLLPSTRDLIGEAELRSMRPHAILVNTARGGIVNEDALLKALDEGWIAAAGIDAYEREPVVLADYPKLIAHDRVIST
jgi:D-3-phosphoglycerate dehydrogenase